MIDETYAVFAEWDFGCSKKENLERLRRENFIGTSTAARLRDFIFVLNRRFDPGNRDRALALLAKHRCAPKRRGCGSSPSVSPMLPVRWRQFRK